MPDKFKIATALLVLSSIYDHQVHRRNKKTFESLVKENENLRQAGKTLMKQYEYLASKMDEHDVPITEFDRIILTNL